MTLHRANARATGTGPSGMSYQHDLSPDLAPQRSLKTLNGKHLAALATIALGTAMLVTGGLTIWLLGFDGLPVPERTRAILDAVKIGLSVGAGSGGLFALYLAWRRQRAIEADHDRQERLLVHTREDATERRITDLYATAVEQLGSDKPAVRHGGIYALERLAQDNPRHRQTVTNVLCAYLRAPYNLPDERAYRLKSGLGKKQYEDSVQEREVRIAIQRLLSDHLRLGDDDQPPESYWELDGLDLTGAVLIDVDFTECKLPKIRLNWAQLFSDGDIDFSSTVFTGAASFDNASFYGVARFRYVTFQNDANFVHAEFHGSAWFDQSAFYGVSNFTEARFEESATFRGTSFETMATFFNKATFNDFVNFDGTDFSNSVLFIEATFAKGVGFTENDMDAGPSEFANARARVDIKAGLAWPTGLRMHPVDDPREGEWAQLVKETSEPDPATAAPPRPSTS